jgi:hypothetical protein
MRPYRVVRAVLLTMLCLLPHTVLAQQPAPAFQYAVKFICGKAAGDVVAPGQYFTAINVHNPADQAISFSKKFAIALPSERPGPVSQVFDARLRPDQALEIDCPDIVQLSPLRGDFLKGFVILESPVELDVVAVYTAVGPSGRVETLELERVPGRRHAGGLPDLIVQQIDPDLLKVQCPSGAGSCVTTATFTIANVGVGNAGTFSVRVVCDPSQSVVVTQPMPAGLGAGATQVLTVTTPPGGNCFDPDCTVCVTVDSTNTVIESNEGNNQLCITKPG